MAKKPPNAGIRPQPVTFDGLPGWCVEIPGKRPIATPAVAGGRVFIGGGYGSRELYAFHADDGRLAWKLDTHDDGPTAAVVSNGTVVFNTESCTVYAVDAATGSIQWEKWLGDPLLAHPAVAQSKVFAAYPSGGSHHLGCYDLATGKELWTQPIGHDVITAPVVSGARVYATTYDGVVRAFDVATGQRAWAADLRATCAPVIDGGRVLVSRRKDALGEPIESLEACEEATGRCLDVYAKKPAAGPRRTGYEEKPARYLRSKKGSAEARALDELDAQVGFSTAPATAKLDQVEALVGEHRVAGSWRYQGSRPAVKNGRCFSIVGDELECIDLSTGDVLWFKEQRDRSELRQLHPPAVTGNDRLFLTTTSGLVLGLDARTGKELWCRDTGHPLDWSPAVVGGRVFLGTRDGCLLAIRTGNPADDGWPMWGGSAAHG
jgi:outer membrane protein assembly factor BamB